jgi:hypothetical protein
VIRSFELDSSSRAGRSTTFSSLSRFSSEIMNQKIALSFMAPRRSVHLGAWRHSDLCILSYRVDILHRSHARWLFLILAVDRPRCSALRILEETSSE